MYSSIRITSVILVLTLNAGFLTAEEPATPETTSASSADEKMLPQTRKNSQVFAEKESAFFREMEARLQKRDRMTRSADHKEDKKGLVIDLNRPVKERINLKLEFENQSSVHEAVGCIPCNFLHLTDPVDHPGWYRKQLEQEKLVHEVLKHSMKNLLLPQRSHQMQLPLYFDGLDNHFSKSGIALA